MQSTKHTLMNSGVKKTFHSIDFVQMYYVKIIRPAVGVFTLCDQRTVVSTVKSLASQLASRTGTQIKNPGYANQFHELSLMIEFILSLNCEL